MTPTDRALLQRFVDTYDAAERLAISWKLARLERNQAGRDARHLLCSYYREDVVLAVREARRLLGTGEDGEPKEEEAP